MKKFLIIVGAVFLLLIAVFCSFIGYSAYKGSLLDRSSAQYIEENIPPIVSTWDPQELIKRCSPELMKTITLEDATNLFSRLKELGQLKIFGKPKGDSCMNISAQGGNQTTASYSVESEFQNGKAQLNIRLILHGKKWSILGFNVDRPL